MRSADIWRSLALIAAQGLHQGLHNVAGLIAIVRNDEDGRVPDMARRVLRVIADAIVKLDPQIAGVEAQIMAWPRSNPMSQRLAVIPDIGPIIATAVAATVAEPSGSSPHGSVSCRDTTPLAAKRAFAGSANEATRTRRLRVNGAHAALLRSKPAKADPWLVALRGRRPRLVVAVALANKMAPGR